MAPAMTAQNEPQQRDRSSGILHRAELAGKIRTQSLLDTSNLVKGQAEDDSFPTTAQPRAGSSLTRSSHPGARVGGLRPGSNTRTEPPHAKIPHDHHRQPVALRSPPTPHLTAGHQAEAIRRLAFALGMTIVREYEDKEYGRVPGDRPQFRRMMDEARSEPVPFGAITSYNRWRSAPCAADSERHVGTIGTTTKPAAPA